MPPHRHTMATLSICRRWRHTDIPWPQSWPHSRSVGDGATQTYHGHSLGYTLDLAEMAPHRHTMATVLATLSICRRWRRTNKSKPSWVLFITPPVYIAAPQARLGFVLGFATQSALWQRALLWSVVLCMQTCANSHLISSNSPRWSAIPCLR